MTSESPRSVVMVTAPGTLRGVDALLRRKGIRVSRITSLATRPVPPRLWLPRLLKASPPDTVILTSRVAVQAGVRPWLETRPRFRNLEFWAVGPGTATALRRAGVGKIHRPRKASASELAKALQRESSRSILYFRSNAAGSRLAATLRGDGHTVLDLIAYRLIDIGPLKSNDQRELARADVLVASSPSALASLRHALDPAIFAGLSHRARLVVLGDRSRRAALGHGFRKVSIAPSATAQRFTHHLLQELRNAQK